MAIMVFARLTICDVCVWTLLLFCKTCEEGTAQRCGS